MDSPIDTSGYLKQPPDDRDVMYVRPDMYKDNSKLPKKADLSKYVRPMGAYDQGWMQSCTAHAIAAALQISTRNPDYEVRMREHGTPDFMFDPSRLYIYWCERLAKERSQFPPDQVKLFIDKIKGSSEQNLSWLST